jgi:hypothetical protein
MPPPPANKPPVILGATPPVTADCTPPTGLSVKLEATVADPNGDALTVIWRANGAKVAEQTIPAGAPNAQTTVSLDHLYPAGNNNVTVTVTDNFSPSVTQTIAVTVIPDATAPVVTTVPAGVTVQADANGNAVVPDFRAQVVAADDCPGTLTVTQDPAPGSTVRGTTTVQLRVTDAAGNFTTVMVTLTVTAPAPPPPPPNAIFATFTQGGWGAKPSGNNPGTLLANNFTRVYPSGVTIGGSKTLRFTSASAVEIFLPAGGTASSLKSSAVNPRSGNVLAGQTLALELNARFSAAGITQSGLGSLKVASGKLAGYTVNQVLLLCNAVLGGNVGSLPPGVSISDLNNIATAINENYDNGTTNKGYLVH